MDSGELPAVKRGRKWIRPGAQVTAICGGAAKGLTVRAVYQNAAEVEIEVANEQTNIYSSRTMSWHTVLLPTPRARVPITQEEEHTLWIRGWHKPDSPMLKALLAAAALRRTE